MNAGLVILPTTSTQSMENQLNVLTGNSSRARMGNFVSARLTPTLSTKLVCIEFVVENFMSIHVSQFDIFYLNVSFYDFYTASEGTIC